MLTLAASIRQAASCEGRTGQVIMVPSLYRSQWTKEEGIPHPRKLWSWVATLLTQCLKDI